MIWRCGFHYKFIIILTMTPNEKTKLVFGVEHETSTNETAFSVRMNMEFWLKAVSGKRNYFYNVKDGCDRG